MRLFVIENGLKGSGGHYFNNCLAIKRSAERRGYLTRFLVNQQAEPLVVDALSAIPCIAFTQFDRISRDPLCGHLESYLVQSSKIASNLLPILSSEARPDDIVLHPTTSFSELGALGLLVDKAPQLRLARFVLNFVVQDFLAREGIQFARNAGLYRMAANRLRRKVPDSRLLLTANGRDMASALSFILDKQVHQYPIPKHYPERLVRESVGNRSRPLIGVFGSMYGPQKGLHLLPGLVESIRGVDWLIQEPILEKKSLWGGGEAAIRSRKNVSFIAHGLDADQYYDHFRSVDVVLTPYMLRVGNIQSSGIVSEAAASGKVVVSPANPWVMERMQNGGLVGVTYAEWTVESISRSIEVALRDLGPLTQKAALAAVEWRERQSADAYLSRALEHFALQPGEYL